jgi:hypothetical protein
MIRAESKMVNVEYHKGSFCIYKAKFCQEGFCSGCEIYLKEPSVLMILKQFDPRVAIKSKEIAR